METIQLYNLNSLCRACLSRTENMTSLFDADDNRNGVCDMFTVMSNFEIEKNDTLPNYLCSGCVDKLNASYEFRTVCQKTQDLLHQFLATDFNAKLSKLEGAGGGGLEDIAGEMVFDEPGGFDENFELVLCDDEDEAERSPRKGKDGKVVVAAGKKQKMRLEQFSYDEVTQAIKDNKRKFLENRKCIRCSFKGSNSRALSIHVSHIHKELKDRWCSLCNGEFDDMAEHAKSHDDDNLKCQFCSKVFGAKGHLTEHLRSHTNVRPFKCDFCEKCFISSRHLKIHRRIHTNERPYKCGLCDRAFIQYNSLKVHDKQHHADEAGAEERTFGCAACGNSFKSKGDLEVHVCVKEEKYLAEALAGLKQEGRAEGDKTQRIRQNFCIKCDRKVRSLSVHNKQHHANGPSDPYDSGPPPKLCTVCGKQFKTSSKLAVHMRVHTGDAPYRCSYCDKRLTTRNHLVVHERVHTGERPHVCGVCKKAFSQSSVLNTHMKLHTGRPEVCSICGQRFCRPAELRLHMRRHTGEKPFACTECSQAFVQKSHLMEHVKIHSDDRPYQCPYCERAFRQRSSLKSHAQIHLGHKPYRCSQCSYACRQSYSLTQHMKQHANDAPRPEKSHVCLVCQRGYTTLAMLTSHANSVHGVCGF